MFVIYLFMDGSFFDVGLYFCGFFVLESILWRRVDVWVGIGRNCCYGWFLNVF